MLYLSLMRPANIMTAIADILTGIAISGLVVHFPGWFDQSFEFLNGRSGSLLILSTIGLYGGGVVLNDVFDAKLDRIERPERPIPSGKVSATGAGLLGILLLFFGVLAAYMAALTSAIIALSITILVVSYNALGKHHSIVGPINMGACRGGNLLLGISAVPITVKSYWYLALIPMLYIGAVTMVSRGEVHGGNRQSLIGAIALYCLVIVSIFGLNLLSGYRFYATTPILVLFCYLIFPPVFKALRSLRAFDIEKAVKSGVLSLIVMDAAIAVNFAGLSYAVLILLLLPISIIIARRFAVT